MVGLWRFTYLHFIYIYIFTCRSFDQMRGRVTIGGQDRLEMLRTSWDGQDWIGSYWFVTQESKLHWVWSWKHSPNLSLLAHNLKLANLQRQNIKTFYKVFWPSSCSSSHILPFSAKGRVDPTTYHCSWCDISWCGMMCDDVGWRGFH